MDASFKQRAKPSLIGTPLFAFDMQRTNSLISFAPWRRSHSWLVEEESISFLSWNWVLDLGLWDCNLQMLFAVGMQYVPLGSFLQHSRSMSIPM